MAKGVQPKSAKERTQGAQPLANKPIAHAYALMPDPHRPGKYFAVHLSDVVASKIEYLEASSRAENVAYGLRRLTSAMEERHRRRAWATDEGARKERPSLSKKHKEGEPEPAPESRDEPGEEPEPEAAP